MAGFRASARTVDMLGRQQIAGIPTAISELFKNAHDAYATSVEVDFFRSRGLFVLRDDGIGMTRQDFEERWLVLGTESKIGGPGMPRPPTPAGVPTRPVLGEKGIGRLAIAAIGPQVLVLTRARRDEELGELVAAFINWSFFELPGVHLDDIGVPLTTFPGGSLPGRSEVEALVNQSFDNFAAVSRRGITVPDTVTDQLARFADTVDPVRLLDAVGGPSLRGAGHGTQFFIFPTTGTLEADIDAGRRDIDTAPPLTKFLVGFTNTMTPDAAPPVIDARFRDWRLPESPDELIADSEFFTPSEFIAADHHITGAFDDFGQFRGTVRIYGQEPVVHAVAWPEAAGVPAECGPFTLDVAVVQGERDETRLDPEQWAALTRKMGRIGGLYIYRDQIRVLPYGNNDYDFLDIERNRTKSAGRYYFSYRRMFGVIQLDSERNAELREKAGREGFRENKAYRQFREILKNFFLQTAVDFFRDGGSAADLYKERQQELKREDVARQRHERLQAQRRRAFQRSLRDRATAVDDGTLERAVGQVLEQVTRDLRRAALLDDPAAAARGYVAAEAHSRAALGDLRAAYRVGPPRGVGMSKALRREWDGYRATLRQVDETLFEPAAAQLDVTVAEVADRLGVEVDLRARLHAGLEATAKGALTSARQEAASLRSLVDHVSSDAKIAVNRSLREFGLAVEQTMADLASQDVDRLDSSALEDLRRRFDDKIEAELERHRARFQQLTLQLDEVRSSTRQDAPVVDVRALEEEELIALRERADADLELMQLGTAIQIINHEYVGSIRSMRENLRRLKTWADRNPSLDRVYQDLRASFDHLDGYLALFTPLQRRLYRKRIEIKGTGIENFVRELFEERLDRHDVNLVATDSFRRFAFTGYPSTFYPVFVNLVDNAIYWSRDRERRIVELDVLGEHMAVTDTGPGIDDRDVGEVFDLGFTRKPAGRGTGLYVCRQVLRRDGYTLVASNDTSGRLGGAVFTIEPVGDVEDGDEDDDAP